MFMAKQQLGLAGCNVSNWEGMLKRLNSDGTYRLDDDYYPEDGTHHHHHHHNRPAAPKLTRKTAEGQKWLMPPEYDIDDIVFQISSHLLMALTCELYVSPEIIMNEDEVLLEPLYNPEDVEELLDELKEYAESTDLALILHSDGHLYPLFLRVLYTRYANIRAKGAELVTTMVQNRLTSQQFVLDVIGLGPFLQNFISDPDKTSRTKALGAIFALIRNNKPGITVFRRSKGYVALKDALSSESVISLQRDALNLIHYLLHEKSSDCNIVIELGLHCIMMHLASSDDAEVREATLRGLLVLARDEEGGDSGQLVKNDDKLKQVLQERIEGISAMAPEELGAAREEIQLVDSLWNACYNEPSSLGEKGLLVLPDEDVPAPDVASKLFEPPLRAWAATEAADRNSVIEKDYNIVTDLGLPCIMMHLATSDAAEVRESALKGLLVLTRYEEGGDNGQLVKYNDKLKQVLQERVERISAMTAEDLGAAKREIQLVDSLWNACYNEPSSLAEKGLLGELGLIEPPLRAAEAADINSLGEKEDPSAATPTQSNSSSKRRKLHGF